LREFSFEIIFGWFIKPETKLEKVTVFEKYLKKASHPNIA
jgi:hypothetical protein